MKSTGIGWAGTTKQFLELDIDTLVGSLTNDSARAWGGSVESAQIFAWQESLGWLRETLASIVMDRPSAATWGTILEYEIPRRGYRIDAVLLADGLIIPIEFKSRAADVSAIRQAEDYGLELSDFHEGSRNTPITPILCSGGAVLKISNLRKLPPTMVTDVSSTPPNDLAQALTSLISWYGSFAMNALDLDSWLNSAYEPVPTIIEAATALYAGHRVEELTRSEASADQLAATENAVGAQLKSAREKNQKVICFITGVPGAGKTLAGLNVVNTVPDAKATFLSGNGPLVKILQKALAVDHRRRNGGTLSDAQRRSSTFVTNVHRWLDEYIDRSPNQIPIEKLVVFDEAQRAWSREHSMRKFNRDASEPEMMLTAMDRHPDWAVIVALVGGGQEINTGEAGLAEWGRALESKFNHWQVAVSPDLLTGTATNVGSMLFDSLPTYIDSQLTVEPDLHLSVSQRSYRTTQLNEWVEAVLDNRPGDAANIANSLDSYPLAITRSLDVARRWLKEHARGFRQSGLVASSGARRLRPHGINVSERFDEADWFLSSKTDVRSSDHLELAATEFAVQGLELDWVGVCWGGDLRRSEDGWLEKRFVGSTWQDVKQPDARRYARNRYRVLLTRAREGLVVWVSAGSTQDPTRSPDIYDRTYDYLLASGMTAMDR